MSQDNFYLELTSWTNQAILSHMLDHYSHPGGFVGRNRCWLIWLRGQVVGSIVGGSSTKHLPGRDEFFGGRFLNHIINNVFFHVDQPEGGYGIRNFTTQVVNRWQHLAAKDWYEFYGDRVIGFETLVELPRTGELYLRAGWQEVGITKGYTCKRIAGKGTDSWGGKRVWEKKKLRPKRVLVSRYVS